MTEYDATAERPGEEAVDRSEGRPTLGARLPALSATRPADDMMSRRVADVVAGDEVVSVVGAAVEEMLRNPSRPIGVALPSLLRLRDRPLDPSRFRKRTQTSLARAEISTWIDLCRASPNAIAAIPAAGQLTVRDACEGATRAALDMSEDEVEVVAPPACPSAPSAIEAALGEVARWLATQRPGARLKDTVVLDPRVVPPAEVADAWRAALALLDVEAEPLVPTPLDDLLGEVLDERGAWIIRTRVLADDPPTLQELGTQLGVTRERVRQLQRKAEIKLDALLSSSQRSEVRLLRWRAHDLARAVGAVAPAGSVEVETALDAGLAGYGEGGRPTATALLWRIAGPYALHVGWLVRAGSSLPSVDDALALADQHGLIEGDELAALLSTSGVDNAHHERWIADQPLRRLDDRTVARWDGNVAAKAVALLAHLDRPATMDELNELIGEGHNVRGARGQLQGHPLAMRSSPKEFSLRAWGGEEYTSIAEQIAAAVDDGPLPIAEVTDRLVNQYGLRPESVRAYIDAPAFVVDGGKVRLRREDEPYPTSSDLRRVRRAFSPREGELVWSTVVDRDILRGAGRAFHPNCGAVLGLSPTADVTFVSEMGSVRATWPPTAFTGPALGSLRAVALGLRAEEGDVLALRLDSMTMTASAALLPSDWSSTMWPQAALLRLTGEPAGDDLRDRLARSIDSRPETVIDDLRDRGDDAIADLLESRFSLRVASRSSE